MNFNKFLFKLFIFFIFVSSLFLIFSTRSIVKAHYWSNYSVLDHPAPIPRRNLPCDEVGPRKIEFHSLRPYQAAPCGDSPQALFCWNDYKLVESLHTKWSLSCLDFGSYYQCPVDQEIEKVYSIDGEYARWPIMGNTEWVINSQNNDEQYSDAQKVNEYVGWYLNGVIGRAEYPPLDVNNPQDIDRIVNTSGPINRLSPLAFTQNLRINTIDDSLVDLSHNQIVVCARGSNPIPCYRGNGSGARGTVYRLEDWNGELSWTNTVAALYGYIINYLTNLIPGVPQSLIDEITTSLYTDHWNSRKPPLPWGKDLLGNEMTALKYQKYYREWEGETCIMATILGVVTMHCYENYFVPNKYADLYPYIPLANTSDKDAVHLFDSINMNPNTGTIAYYKHPPDNDPIAFGSDQQPSHSGPANPAKIHSPVLYYPHTQETYDLSQYLNSIFTPSKTVFRLIDGLRKPVEVNFSTPSDYEVNGCEIVDVRSNEGDYLFPSSSDSRVDDITAYVDVQIDAIGCPADPINTWRNDCDDDVRSGCELASSCELPPGKEWCPIGCEEYPIPPPYCPPGCVPNVCGGFCGPYPDKCKDWPDCDGNITFMLNTTPRIPYAREIWQSTVVGSESTFRKIFPKTGEGTPVECIADIPGTSLVQYAPLPNSEYTPLVSVSTPVSENPLIGGVVNSQLYFPYQGTVYEYFLKGIQTALRPLGYGHPIPQGENCTNLICGELPDLPPASNACQLKSGNINGIAIPDSLATILEAAAETYQVPAGLIVGVMFGEGAFNLPPYQKYDWTETNVLNWATCVPLPGCSSPETSVIPFIGTYWNQSTADVLKELKKLDPSKFQVDPCNLLDVIYVAAHELSSFQYGNPVWPSTAACNGIKLNRGTSSTNGCNWQANDYETSIRIWEFGYCYGLCPQAATDGNVLTCATEKDSCFTGGGFAMQCSSDGAYGPYDSCKNTTGHNQCVYRVSRSH